ncbi:hypothetical protein SAMN05216582_12069 [Selenomonas ruminantium]|uniref:Zinc-ribbon domain-containing protein n=1 Tax=Selenomonas ruminantium TaxID=971 RepID=A0A1M6VTT8_SELRU|nr:hypothetical protein [Selenomonas ruminantium]SHK84819.1 hypothetical protein SAMN05216582_12069 [Selenomonas ruminantium]
MICKKCGCILEPEAKICAFCGEVAEAGESDLMTNFVGDDGAREILASMPQLVSLHQLDDVPLEKEQLLAELNRLQGYFSHIRGKYATLGDLWMMRAQYAEPKLANYTVGGGIFTLFFYLILTGFFPTVPWTFFFVVWLGVTSVSYVQAGKAYERRKAYLEADIRGIENEVRTYYNQADHCFLPLDYTDPKVIRELIAGISSGAITSFREVKV